MVELIFVIVILGVLAAVAIPKLAVSRNDAQAATVAYNLADCVGFLGSAYLADGLFDLTSEVCVAATVDNVCFTIIPENINGSLFIQHILPAPLNSVCSVAHRLATDSGVSSNVGIRHQF